MSNFIKDDIKNILKKYITTKSVKIGKRKNKTLYNTYEDSYNINMHNVLKENEPLLYEYLTNLLGNSFTSVNLYNYLNGTTEYCVKCGKKLDLISLNKGYAKCDCEKRGLKTKKEIYDYLCEHFIEYGCTKYGIVETLKQDNVFKDKIDFTNINTSEDLYLYLTDSEQVKCCICGKPSKFNAFKVSRGGIYQKCCSKECLYKLRSKNQIENNTCHRINPEKRKQMEKHHSLVMKEKIKNGEFNPCVINSWCNITLKIKYKNKDEIKEGKYRSTWEAMFQLMNPDLLYEKLRIPYFDKSGNPHIYIVDFIDIKNKIAYEIKPSSLIDKRNNGLKRNALKKWCLDNDYKEKIITEEYFENNEFKLSLLNYTDQENRDRIVNIIKNYNFNIDYEN